MRPGEGAQRHVGRRFRVEIALGLERTAKEVRRELQAHDLLAPVRKGLGELHDARQHIGIGVDSLGIAQKLGAALRLLLVRASGQRDELFRLERAANAPVARLTGHAQHGYTVGMNVLAHDSATFRFSDSTLAQLTRRVSLSCLHDV
jgi:hypothetical protein